MNKIITILSMLVIINMLSGCGTSQSNEDEISETAYVPVVPPVVSVVPYCTKLPLMTDLTKPYQNRVYIEDGQPCTKNRRDY